MDMQKYLTLDYATLVLAAAAFVVSVAAWWQSKRSADATVAAAKATKDAADASERSAAAAEGATTAALDGVRIARDSLTLQQRAMAPKVVLRIRRIGHGNWRIQNDGTASAVGIGIYPGDGPLFEDYPDFGSELAPNDSRELSFNPMQPPASVRFRWEGQEDPVYVPVEAVISH